jgi:hypothetical protein
MERRRLVERQAGDPFRPGQRHVQRDAAAIGVADEMQLALACVDERDRPGSLVREREGCSPVHGPVLSVPKCSGRKHLVLATQRFRQVFHWRRRRLSNAGL